MVETITGGVTLTSSTAPGVPHDHPHSVARSNLAVGEAWGRPRICELEVVVAGEEGALGDLPASCREEFLYAVELARAQHDPATDWEGFRDTLWSYLTRVFGVEDSSAWPPGFPDPEDGPGGDAREVAGWLGQADTDLQRSVTSPRP